MALGPLVPLPRDAIICLICSGFRIGVVSEQVIRPCATASTIVFCLILPCSSGCSGPVANGGCGVAVLGGLSFMIAVCNPSFSDERSTFSPMGSMSFSLLFSVCTVC